MPKSLSNAALYGTTNAIQVPLNDRKEEFVVTHTRHALLYRDSKDAKVSGAGIVIRTGKKWSAFRDPQIAEEKLRHRALVSTVTSGTTGLGYFPRPRIANTRGKERRALLQKEVRAGMDDTQLTKMVGLSHQGAWTKWKNYDRRRVTWSDLRQSDYDHLRFQIQAVYDVLPCPSNLHTWSKSVSPACPLCEGRGSLQQLLSGCKESLSKMRYRWRYDQVLKAITEVVTEALKSNEV